MAVNKVEFGNKTLIDLTEDTVTPETLLNGATAHSANGKRIVGTLIGGTPVVEVSQAEYDALTDEEKAADILYIITDSYPSRELARNVGLDAITGLNATTVQAGIEILTKLIDVLSSKVRDCDTSSVKVRYANRNVDTNELLLFNGANVNTKGYISNYLYSTIDSIVASVNTLNSNKVGSHAYVLSDIQVGMTFARPAIIYLVNDNVHETGSVAIDFANSRFWLTSGGLGQNNTHFIPAGAVVKDITNLHTAAYCYLT